LDTDLAFDGSDFSLVESAAEVAQRVRCRLTTVLGEIPDEPKKGLPWYTVLMGSEASFDLRASLIFGLIQETEGVKSVTKFEASVDGERHLCTINFEATTIYGSTGLVQVTV
jgi:hypothetical protein